MHQHQLRASLLRSCSLVKRINFASGTSQPDGIFNWLNFLSLGVHTDFLLQVLTNHPAINLPIALRCKPIPVEQASKSTMVWKIRQPFHSPFISASPAIQTPKLFQRILNFKNGNMISCLGFLPATMFFHC